MSTNKEENPSLTGYYSMEKFIKGLKKISGLPEIPDTNDDFEKLSYAIERKLKFSFSQSLYNLGKSSRLFSSTIVFISTIGRFLYYFKKELIFAHYL